MAPMSLDPLKRLISIAGLCMLFALLYSVFSGFFLDVQVNQQFPAMESNHVVELVTPIESATIAAAPSSGTLYYISYQKGKVVYIENLSMRSDMEVVAYFSTINTYRDGPVIGSLLGSKGNVTLYVPSDLDIKKYPFIIFWSGNKNQVFAYANITGLR